MSTKSKRSESDTSSRAPDRATSSYDNAQGHSNDDRPNAAYPKMPHERDESARTRESDDHPSAKRIEQAQEDVESGQVDTDRRGVPDNVPVRNRPS